MSLIEQKTLQEMEKLLVQAISPFPTMFSEGFFPRPIKRCHCVGMGPYMLVFVNCMHVQGSVNLMIPVLVVSKSKAFADDYFNVDLNVKFFFNPLPDDKF